MFTRTVTCLSATALLLFSTSLISQQTSVPVSTPVALEFPVTMQQKVVAGKTPVGAKVSAKLVVATLVNGVVIPRNAVFSGEVIESVAKSAASPSRLGIRMDSVQWKKGSAPIKAYLIAWYYPIEGLMDRDLTRESPEESPSQGNLGADANYPNSGLPSAQPFPGWGPRSVPDLAPTATASNISTHRVRMKNVESTSDADGSIAIASHASTIKLDKLTTYVLATGELLPKN